jgi:K+-sensing histidine kinase KdpD
MPKGVFRYSKPDRDRRILEQLQVGRQNSQIARSLGLSAATVRMYISEIFDGEVLAMLPDEKHKLRVAAGDVSSVIQSDVVKHMGVARSAYETGQMAGWGTGSSPATEVLYVPLQAADTTAGGLVQCPIKGPK